MGGGRLGGADESDAADAVLHEMCDGRLCDTKELVAIRWPVVLLLQRASGWAVELARRCCCSVSQLFASAALVELASGHMSVELFQRLSRPAFRIV